MAESREALARRAALEAGIPHAWHRLRGGTLDELRADADRLVQERDAGRTGTWPDSAGQTPAEFDADLAGARAELHAARRGVVEAQWRHSVGVRDRALESVTPAAGTPATRPRERRATSRTRASSVGSDEGSDLADEPPLGRRERALRPAPELQITIPLEGEARLRVAALSYGDQERLLIYLATSDALVAGAVALLELAERLLDEEPTA
jgi:hypothetical protein